MNYDVPFWEVPGFWPVLLVLLAVAAVMAFVICAGPGEVPYDGSHEHSLSRLDADTKHSWGISVPEWNVLPDESRAWYRENITKGPHFEELIR